MKAYVLIAAICHSVNAAYCASIGDLSQPSWGEAPDWQKASAVDGVQFHLANPDAGDSASHDNWLKHKEADGWVFGETKDADKKTHPCMVPFDQLPPEQQMKDRLFRTIVHAAKPIVELESELQATGEALELAGQTEATLRGQLAEFAAARDAAEKRAKVAKGSAGPKARKVKAMDPMTDDERIELGERVSAGEAVQIVFSDGKRELMDIAPIVVSGPAFDVSPARLMLREAVNVSAAGTAGRELQVSSLALFDDDGEQLAFAELPMPLTISPGRTYRLDRQIQF